MTQATIDAARRYGASAVVVHMGKVDIDWLLVEQLRQLHQVGRKVMRAYLDAQEKLAVTRVLRREPCFAAALRSLVSYAAMRAKRGVRLGLENRVNYHEIPSLEEAKDLLSASQMTPSITARCRPCPRPGGARLHAAGRLAQGAEQAAIGDALARCTGINDHRIPGTGDVDSP